MAQDETNESRLPPARANGPRRLPFGLLGMLPLLFAIERQVDRCGPDLSTVPLLNARYAAARASQIELNGKVVFLGDSQVKFGVDPREFESRSGRAAVNLAIAGSPPPASYFLLRRILDRGARPSAIVVGHMTFAGDLEIQSPLFHEFVQLSEAVDLSTSTRDPQFLVRLLLPRYLPSIKDRHAIRNATLDTLLSRPQTTGLRPFEHVALWDSARGAELMDPNPLYGGGMEPDKKDTLYGQPWRVSGLYAHYFHRLVDLAEKNEIPVYWVVFPIVGDAQFMREQLGHDSAHTQNLRALQKRHPRLTIFDARHSHFDTNEFYDSCHLNRLGATRISAALGDLLARESGDLAGRIVEIDIMERGQQSALRQERAKR